MNEHGERERELIVLHGLPMDSKERTTKEIFDLLDSDIAFIKDCKSLTPLFSLSDIKERKWSFPCPTIYSKTRWVQDNATLYTKEFIANYYHNFPFLKHFYTGSNGEVLARHVAICGGSVSSVLREGDERQQYKDLDVDLFIYGVQEESEATKILTLVDAQILQGVKTISIATFCSEFIRDALGERVGERVGEGPDVEPDWDFISLTSIRFPEWLLDYPWQTWPLFFQMCTILHTTRDRLELFARIASCFRFKERSTTDGKGTEIVSDEEGSEAAWREGKGPAIDEKYRKVLIEDFQIEMESEYDIEDGEGARRASLEEVREMVWNRLGPVTKAAVQRSSFKEMFAEWLTSEKRSYITPPTRKKKYSLPKSWCCKVTQVRTKNAITYSLASSAYVRWHSRKWPSVQVILRYYPSVSSILYSFDLPASAVGFDGKEVWFTSLSRVAYETGVMVINPHRRSPTFEYRLSKYFGRGFAIGLPHFNIQALKKVWEERCRIGKKLETRNRWRKCIKIGSIGVYVDTVNPETNQIEVEDVWWYGPNSPLLHIPSEEIYNSIPTDRQALKRYNIQNLVAEKWENLVWVLENQDFVNNSLAIQPIFPAQILLKQIKTHTKSLKKKVLPANMLNFNILDLYPPLMENKEELCKFIADYDRVRKDEHLRRNLEKKWIAMHKKFVLEKLKAYLGYLALSVPKDSSSTSPTSIVSSSTSSTSTASSISTSSREVSLPVKLEKPNKISFYPTPATFTSFYGAQYYVKKSEP